MELSVRETAALLGRSARTVRAQVARGDLPGVKRGGRWYIERRHLPLTEAQRQSLQTKASSVRRAVEEALPSRLAATQGQRRRSLADLDAFRYGAEVLDRIRAAEDEALPESAREVVTGELEQALLALAEAAEQFEREVKLEALRRARAALARVTGALLLHAGIPPREPVHSWVVDLESKVLPAVAGFARWTDGLRRKRR